MKVVSGELGIKAASIDKLEEVVGRGATMIMAEEREGCMVFVVRSATDRGSVTIELLGGKVREILSDKGEDGGLQGRQRRNSKKLEAGVEGCWWSSCKIRIQGLVITKHRANIETLRVNPVEEAGLKWSSRGSVEFAGRCRE